MQGIGKLQLRQIAQAKRRRARVLAFYEREKAAGRDSSMDTVGKRFGLSRQRAHQLVQLAVADREPAS